MKEVLGVFQRAVVSQRHATIASVLLREPIAMVARPVTPHYKTLQKQRGI